MPRILKKTTEISHEEWLELRRTGIGGSDSSTVCGLNPYSSLIALWADKTGRMPPKEDNEAMRIGRDLEEYVAKRFAEATGKKVRRRNAIFQHDTYDFITANIDREIVGENAGLECKTTSVLNKSDFEGGQIPLDKVEMGISAYLKEEKVRNSFSNKLKQWESDNKLEIKVEAPQAPAMPATPAAAK